MQQQFNSANFQKSQPQDRSDRSDTNSVNSVSKNNITNDTDAKKKIKKKKIHHGLIANLVDTQYSVVKKVVKGMLGIKVVREAGSDDWDLYWTDNAVTAEQLGKMKPFQKINHFPGMYTLSRKNYLARNLIKMEKKFPNDYNFFPKTWVLPSELNDLRKFMEAQPHSVVIAKPEASSQGKGIFLTKSFEDFEYGEHYVVQKYLKKPFLIEGLKFDLRVYVLVSGCDPLRLYIFKEGLARFATETYCVPKKQNLKNFFMHLTNYAINKNSDKFQFNSSPTEMNKGHKRSLTSILETIESLGHSKQKVWSQIKDCIAKTMISAQPLLAHQYKSSQPNNQANNMCFEILGFDVILDQHLKAQILEVNYTPSFTTDTPLDLEIKKQLIHDSLLIMNLTNKAKNQIINEKKREMKERTLTGKNFYQSRQERQDLAIKRQKQRNGWENNHLGNFQRILPVIIELPPKKQTNSGIKKQIDSGIFLDIDDAPPITSIDFQKDHQKEVIIELQQKYKLFLEYSTDCYHANTGANIKRNNKVVKSGKNNEGFSRLSEEYVNSKQNNVCQNSKQNLQALSQFPPQPQTIKFTNSQNLQKIYKTKFRPMYSKKGMQTSLKKKAAQNNDSKTPPLIKTAQQIKSEEKQAAKQFKQSSPYAETGFGIGKVYSKNKTSNSQKRVRSDKMSKGGVFVISDQEVLLNPVSYNRGISTGKNGLSNVYNITFNERKL